MDTRLELIAEEEKITQGPDFWNDPKKAEVVLKSIQEKKSWTNAFSSAEASPLVKAEEIGFTFAA